MPGGERRRASGGAGGFSLARPEGLEPPAYWFEANRSIQLSYGRASGDRDLMVSSRAALGVCPRQEESVVFQRPTEQNLAEITDKLNGLIGGRITSPQPFS